MTIEQDGLAEKSKDDDWERHDVDDGNVTACNKAHIQCEEGAAKSGKDSLRRAVSADDADRDRWAVHDKGWLTWKRPKSERGTSGDITRTGTSGDGGTTS